MSENPLCVHASRGARRTAILGGTFDPVHHGHLSVAREVLRKLSFDRVVFVPAYVPPHKDHAPLASPADRVRMLILATGAEPGFEVDTFEVDREGVSFTIATIRHFASIGLFVGRPGLIIGEDLLAGFDSWREADELERLTDIVVVRRPGSAPGRFKRRHLTVENSELDIASSDIRERVRTGRPYSSLVPEDVARYIEAQALYR